MPLIFRTSGLFVTFLLLVLLFESCKHEPILPDENPIDTITNPIDTTTLPPPDTTDINDNPCLPNVIYFERDVLPILLSNCAKSGCHDASSHEDGVILDSYINVMNTADVEPNDLDGSDIYEVITEDDPDKIMPRPPNSPLSSAQISIIGQWISQGAQNLTCDETNGCNTENVSFSATVFPIIQNYCMGCHSGSSPQGGQLLTNYAQISATANSGKLIGVLNGTSYTPMPYLQPPLNACFIDKIEAWVNSGSPNN